MKSSLRMMTDLLDALFDISKLDGGAVVAEKRDFNIRYLLQRVVIDNQPAANEKGLTFDCKVPDCIVASDPLLLERIVENLVSNAIHYTK